MLPNAVPKPKPRLLETRAKKAALETLDKSENEKARKRANGRCEVFVIGEGRCTRRDTQTHHMLGGIGRRKLGISALAIHKQRTCDRCHSEITNHLLTLAPVGEVVNWQDPYQRVWK